jgi:DNA repair exonuclease SbcCD nuclease subunit
VVARAASDIVDVVVVAGDLLDIGSTVPLDTQIIVVLSYLQKLADRKPTLVCSGNHDLDSRRSCRQS